MTGHEWSGISEGARHLVRSLLTLRPDKRLTVEQALKHPWIQNITYNASAFDNPASSLSYKAMPASNMTKALSLGGPGVVAAPAAVPTATTAAGTASAKNKKVKAEDTTPSKPHIGTVPLFMTKKLQSIGRGASLLQSQLPGTCSTTAGAAVAALFTVQVPASVAATSGANTAVDVNQSASGVGAAGGARSSESICGLFGSKVQVQSPPAVPAAPAVTAVTTLNIGDNYNLSCMSNDSPASAVMMTAVEAPPTVPFPMAVDVLVASANTTKGKNNNERLAADNRNGVKTKGARAKGGAVARGEGFTACGTDLSEDEIEDCGSVSSAAGHSDGDGGEDYEGGAMVLAQEM